MYREELPEGCPPPDAIEIENEWIGYRFVSGTSPAPEDFDSHFRKDPSKRYPDPCIAKALSLEADFAQARKRLELPKFKNGSICQVTLDRGAGRIKQTGASRTHYSWWPYNGWGVIECSRIV